MTYDLSKSRLPIVALLKSHPNLSNFGDPLPQPIRMIYGQCLRPLTLAVWFVYLQFCAHSSKNHDLNEVDD